jgi:type IV pilus assembly protein PilA
MRKLVKRFIGSFKQGEKGFTLIELLVVVAILGVLAAVAVPNIASFLSKGNDTAIASNAASIQTAADAYATEHAGTYPVSNAEILPYLRTLPTIGTYNIDNGTVTYTTSGNGVINY